MGILAVLTWQNKGILALGIAQSPSSAGGLKLVETISEAICGASAATLPALEADSRRK
jgi:hypothetical protein